MHQVYGLGPLHTKCCVLIFTHIAKIELIYAERTRNIKAAFDKYLLICFVNRITITLPDTETSHSEIKSPHLRISDMAHCEITPPVNNCDWVTKYRRDGT